MSLVHGKGAAIFADKDDISHFLNSVGSSMNLGLEDATTFGKNYKGYIPGLGEGALDLQGLYDGATDGIDEIVEAHLGLSTDFPVTVVPEGGLLGGQRTQMCAGKFGTYDITTPVGGIVSISLQAVANNGLWSGVNLTNVATQWANGVTDPVSVTQPGAATSTSFGWTLNYHCVFNTSSVATTWKIQDSLDNVTFADLTGATAITAGIGTKVAGTRRSATGATIGKYLRAVPTISAGTGYSLWVFSMHPHGAPIQLP